MKERSMLHNHSEYNMEFKYQITISSFHVVAWKVTETQQTAIQTNCLLQQSLKTFYENKLNLKMKFLKLNKTNAKKKRTHKAHFTYIFPYLVLRTETLYQPAFL